ncbi:MULTISPECIES: L-threonylcarbamoyladenylate synthase [unclassified Paraflavitalea]|uniref:L-threonylcarbamoyladenylate synthase n=1 Tax=unclassified Paraflavitalea TaxID=2798305 RepID=UPI003D330B26
MSLEQDIAAAVNTLREGGIILYPTDTIWGIGCDATNETAVAKIYALKKRAESKSMIVLLADERSLLQYIAAPDVQVFDFLETVSKPTTIIYDGAIGLADNVINADGSIGIRICKDELCKAIIKRLGKPLVSTSANISGQASPAFYAEISEDIKQGVDYIMNHRQNDTSPKLPSTIIKWGDNGVYTVIRP